MAKGGSIIVIGTDYRVKLMNRAAREFADTLSLEEPVFRYQISHQRGMLCSGIEHTSPLKRVRETGHQVTVVYEHHQANGERRFIEVLVSPLWGADGSFKGIVECIS